MANNSIFNSIKWSGIEKLSQFIVQFIVTVVLARILGPEEYAVIGILNIFIVISSILVDSGLSQSLIKKTDCRDIDYNTVFWFNFAISVFIYLILFIASPFIAKFFNNEELLWTSRVLFLVIPVQALNVIQNTIVNKNLEFKKIAFFSVIGSTISGVTGIVIALLGYGVWALIAQALLFQIISVFLYWSASSWHPAIQFSRSSFKELFPFSIKLAGASLVNAVFNNLYSLSIAKFYPAVSFGYYTQAQKFATVPTNIIEAMMNRVAYPTLSRVQENKNEYEGTFWRIQRGVFAIVAPIMIFLAVCGYETIVLLLGIKWEGSVEVFRILCLAGITIPLHPIILSVLKIANSSGVILVTEFIKKSVLVLAIVISFKYGINGLAWSQVVYLWICLLINMICANKYLSFSLGVWIAQILKYLVIALLPAIPCYFFSFLSSSLYLSLTIKMVVYFFCYLLLLRLFRCPEHYLLEQIFNRFIRKQKV